MIYHLNNGTMAVRLEEEHDHFSVHVANIQNPEVFRPYFDSEIATLVDFSFSDDPEDNLLQDEIVFKTKSKEAAVKLMVALLAKE